MSPDELNADDMRFSEYRFSVLHPDDLTRNAITARIEALKADHDRQSRA
jgi:hypothetical protein